MQANLAYPLDVMLRNRRWFILDGVHRLAKAVALGHEAVHVRRVPAEMLPLIAAANADGVAPVLSRGRPS
jgi:hypothetical protein